MSSTSKKIISSVRRNAGKVTVVTILMSIVLMCVSFLLGIGNDSGVGPVFANDMATTSVNVLNVPPFWSVDAEESSMTQSSTSTPTNVDTNMMWTGTATEANGEDFYLLVCKSSTTPDVSGAVPTCLGGASNQWAISPLTTQATNATATYAVVDSDDEVNQWYAYVCDGNPGGVKCNGSVKTGTEPTASPWHANHRPSFTGMTIDPVAPGALLTATTTAIDSDVADGRDILSLFLCRADDFTGTACGPSGEWASSSIIYSQDPEATSTMLAILPDGATSTWAYIIDEHNLTASTTGVFVQGVESSFTILNATPTISAGNITLYDFDSLDTELNLVNDAGETYFNLEVKIDDANSCAYNEVLTLEANIYRTNGVDVGSSTCMTFGTDYNVNNCYTADATPSVWDMTCTASSTSCLGTGDSDVIYECTFPLWFTADATLGVSLYTGDDWLASVRASDDNFATSTWTEGSNIADVQQFMSFNIATTSIDYGAIQPGDSTPNVDADTVIEATGNVGLDILLDGTWMCSTFGTGCLNDPTSTIPASDQRFSTSTRIAAVPFSATLETYPLSSTTPFELEIDSLKTVSTSTYAVETVYWGIFVPGAIGLSGDYSGENTFLGKVAEVADWY